MYREPIKVLVVEQSEHDYNVTCDVLSEAREQRFCTVWRSSLHSALEFLSKEFADIVLLDLCLPDSRGVDSYLRLYAHAPGMPIVILTALEYEREGDDAVSRGAQECLLKGELDSRWLSTTMVSSIHRQRIRNSLRLEYAISDILTASDAVEDAIPRILQEICSLMGWDCGAFWSMEQQGERLRCAELWRRSAQENRSFDRLTREGSLETGEDLPGKVMSSRVPASTVQLNQDNQSIRYAAAFQEGFRGAFAFPVLCVDQLVAAVEFLSRDTKAPDIHTEEMFASIGTYMGQWLRRKETEVELLRQKQLLQSVVDCMPDGVIVADNQGKFLLWNPAAQEISGMGLTDTKPEEWSEVYGCYFLDGTPYKPEELPLVRAMAGESIDGAQMLVRNKHNPEGRKVVISARPLLDSSGKSIGGLVSFRDT